MAESAKQLMNFCFLSGFPTGQIKFFCRWQREHLIIRFFAGAAPGMGEIYPFILCSQIQDCG